MALVPYPIRQQAGGRKEIHVFQVTSREVTEQKTLVRRAKVRGDAISDFLGPTYAAVAEVVVRGGFRFAGPPFARFRPLDEEFAEFDVEAGFPVAGEGSTSNDVEVSSLPGGTMAVVVHIGPYDAMLPAYQAIFDWMAERDARAEGPAWEVYHSDPDEQPDPATWRTEIYQPYSVG
jgi:effector-binding domain-containing protein